MRRYSKDPRWLNLKYPYTKGGTTYPAGTRAFYFPLSKTMLFGDEAQDAANRFDCEAADETQYGQGYGV